MRFEHRRSRFASILILLVSAAVSAVAADVAPPRYCDVAALRVDASLRAIDFRNAQIGLAVGAHGAIARTDDGGNSWQIVESTVPYQLDDVAWLDGNRVVAVGGYYDPITQISRAVVIFSTDAGRRWWRAADQELPRLRSIRVRVEDGALVAASDWSAVSLEREYESRDGGRTWNPTGELDGPVKIPGERSSQDLVAWIKTTRTPVAIRDAVQTAAGAIWAVGDHGMILHREHAQDSWQVRRGAENRTGVLIVSANPQSVAWPLLGRESLEAGNRVALLLLRNPSSRPFDATASEVDLVRQAAANVGVSSVDIGNVHANADLRSRAADWMIIHRPAVVVIDGALDQPTRVALAETAISYGAQRVVGYSFKSDGGTVLHRSALLPRRGTLASDLWQDAFSLVAPGASQIHSISLKSLYDSGSSRLRGDTVASGLRLTRGQRLDAEFASASRRQLQIAQARLNHVRQVEKLIGESANGEQFSNGLKTLLDQTAKSDQSRLAWSIYRQLSDSENIAADIAGFNEVILDEIADRFEHSSLAWYASLRLQTMQKSNEWNRLRSAFSNRQKPSAVSTASSEAAVSPFQTETSQVKQASAVTPLKLVDTTPVDATPQMVRPDMVDLSIEFHPLALIVREAARIRGDEDELQSPDGMSANLRRLRDSSKGDWSRLLHQRGPQVIAAKSATSPPRLDGVLNDDCWSSALPEAGAPQRIRCAYDEQFIYLAITTPEREFRSGELPGSERVRDRDLTPVDRVAVRVDSDLDLLTSYDFQFSRDGRTHDSIDGFAAWQPTWYVASKPAEGFVHTELAINRRDLVDLPVVPGQSWFVNVGTMTAGQPTFFSQMPRPGDWNRIVFY